MTEAVHGGDDGCRDLWREREAELGGDNGGVAMVAAGKTGRGVIRQTVYNLGAHAD
ncbi:tripartite tricarboxylate transporter substrate binding protein [Sesbania bispinosa]|nr:tripartite tricarboxylate transporter substrate binding protein [Sesbania bispinosa]